MSPAAVDVVGAPGEPGISDRLWTDCQFETLRAGSEGNLQLLAGWLRQK